MNDRLRILYFLGMIIILTHTEICYVISRAQSSGKQPPITVCDTTTLSDGKLYVDCSNRNLRIFPVFEEARTIHILNISENPSLFLRKHVFLNLTELDELSMVNANLDTAEPDFLAPLIKLRVLNFSYTYFTSLNNLKLPSKIQKLYMDNLIFESRETVAILQYLSDLEELSVQSNHYKDFPKLNETCPLIFIDLSGNDLLNLKYNDLAPFCTLETLLLSYTKFDDSEACCGVKSWTTAHDIYTTLVCSRNCEISDFDENAKEAYRKCEERLRQPGVSLLLFLLAFFFVMALLGVFLILVYRHYSSPSMIHKKEEEEEEEVLDEEG